MMMKCSFIALFSLLLALIQMPAEAKPSLRSSSSPSLTVNPSLISDADNVSVVTLTWTGAPQDPNGNMQSVIGAYFSLDAPYPYGVKTVDAEDGSIDMEVLNFRQPFVFKLLRLADSSGISNEELKAKACQFLRPGECEDTGDYTFAWSVQFGKVLATSDPVQFEHLDAPTQIRLAIGNDPSEMRIMWTSKNNGKTPKVRVSRRPSMTDATTFTGTTDTYSIYDMCNATGIGPVNYSAPATLKKNYLPPGIQNDILVTGLKPSSRYYYQVANEVGSSDWSKVESFITSPPVGTDESVEGIVFGDTGLTMPWTTVVPHEKSNYSNFAPADQTREFLMKATSNMDKPLSIVHIGDLSYAVGYAVFWEYFMSRQISPIAARVPYMVGIGNHEYDWPTQPFDPSWANYALDSGVWCSYFKRFHMPGPGNATVRNLYYSFDWGPIHYIVMSTETDFVESSPQYEWIKNDLASVNRDDQPWIIFMGHRPMYTSSNSWSVEHYLQKTYEPLFRQYHVDLALWGHVHQYERTVPISYNGTEVPPGHGTVHVVIGNGGNTFQVPWRDSTTHFYPVPSWIVFRSHDYGVGGIKANKETLEFAMHDDNRFLVHDKFALHSANQKFRQSSR